MAGAGFKSFAAGEVLLASEVNTFLMEQTVMVFDSAAARDGVITAPSEGMLCYLKDTNAVEKYTGSDWVAVVEDTSPITTEGDLIVGDASGDPVRLPVGAAGEVLTSDGVTVSFVAPAATAPNWSLLNAGGTALTGAATITISGITAQKGIMVLVEACSSANANSQFRIQFNGDSGANYTQFGGGVKTGDTYDKDNFGVKKQSFSSETGIVLSILGSSQLMQLAAAVTLFNADSTGSKNFVAIGSADTTGASVGQINFNTQGIYEASAVITSVSIVSSSGNFDNGTIFVLGAS